MSPLRSHEGFTELVQSMESPVLGMLAGALFTALVQSSSARKGVPMERAMAMELMDAYQNQGNVVKKRDDTHRMAQANKAFAHYAW